MSHKNDASVPRRRSRGVADLVHDDGPLMDAVSRGIVNFRALSRWLKSTYGLSESEEAILSSLRRELRSRRTTPLKRARGVIANCHVNVRTRTCQIVTPMSPTVQERLPEIVRRINFPRGEILYVTEGQAGLKLLVDEENLKMVQQALGSNVEFVTTGLAALIMVFPRHVLETPGVLALSSMALALQDINAFDILFSYPELVFFVHQKDAQRAFQILDTLATAASAEAR